MSVEVSNPRPSDARRAALRDADAALGEGGVPLVSNFFPIERYYDAAEKVLLSFRRAFDERRLDDAYVYGKRFAAFSLDALPSHNYYKSSRFSNLRNRNKQDLTEVIEKLEKIARWMDEEEIKRERERKRLEEERIAKQQEAEMRRYRELQQRIAQQKQRGPTGVNVEKSARNKLELLSGENGTRSNRRPRNDTEEELLDSFDSPESEDRDPFMNDLSRSFARKGKGVGRQHGEGRSVSSLDDKDVEGSSRRRTDAERTRRRHSQIDVVDSQGLEGRRPRKGDDDDSMGSSASRRTQNRRKSTSPKPDGRSSRPSRRSSMGGEYNMPPPIPPPSVGGSVLPPPPSYNSVVGDSRPGFGFPPPNGDTGKGFPPTPEEEDLLPSYATRERERQRRPSRMPIRKLREVVISDYKSLKQDKRIEVFGLKTFQGRLRHSTNGCAVISPLVVSHHLRHQASVADAEIVDVIDNECGPLLREIRSKLELEGTALIIPSDVHDHLVDRKILSQDGFIGATGGNILDRSHIGEFLKLLDSGEKKSHKDKKTGAALFFREHVVSIVKVPAGRSGKFYYDLIDSMPGLSDSLNRRLATRTRCKDIAAFEALIRWYATTKFSESNCNYIDKNEWDEMMADFDPRVFQAFVWGDTAK